MIVPKFFPREHEILPGVSHVCACSFEFSGLKEIEIVVQITKQWPHKSYPGLLITKIYQCTSHHEVTGQESGQSRQQVSVRTPEYCEESKTWASRSWWGSKTLGIQGGRRGKKGRALAGTELLQALFLFNLRTSTWSSSHIPTVQMELLRHKWSINSPKATQLIHDSHLFPRSSWF